MTTLGEYLKLRNASAASGVEQTQANRGTTGVQTKSNPIDFGGATGGVGDRTDFTTGNSRTREQIQAEIDELTKQKEDNTLQIDKIKAEITELERERDENDALIKQKEQEVIQKRQQAARQQEEAQRQQENTKNNYKQQSEQVAQTEIEKYEQANKNGDGMTKEELSANIAAALPQVSGIESAQTASGTASDLDAEADSLEIEIANLKVRNSEIDGQIKLDEKEIQDLEEENKAIDVRLGELQTELQNAQNQSSGGQNGSNSAGTGDPIGFEVDGEMYEFIVDDGAFDETSDFLGYKDQWTAMEKLDTNGDGTVDIKELQSGNIKLVNSKGEVGDIEKLFGKDFSVDLKSYDKNGKYDVDSADHDGDGIANQQLLGTFDVNISKDKKVTGRNTLDDNDFLSQKYGIEDSSKSNNGSIGDKFKNFISKLFSTNPEDNSPAISSNNISSGIKAGVSAQNSGVAQSEINSIKEEVITNALNSVGEEDKNKEKDKSNPFGF